jgi:phosphatidylglycerophosphatase A
MTRLAVLIASFGYTGYFPIAPGTAGSAAALVLYLLVRSVSPGARPLVEALVLVVVALVGTWSATIAERYFKATDPGQIVIDEVLGMLMTLAFLPLHWTGVIIGFFVFRALDIVKPFPANVAEQLHGGTGVMADDAVSGVYGQLVMRALVWLLPAWM